MRLLSLLLLLLLAPVVSAGDYGLWLNGTWTEPQGTVFTLPGRTLVGQWRPAGGGYDFILAGQTVAHQEAGITTDAKTGVAIVPPAPLVLGSSPSVFPLCPTCPNGQCPRR